MRGVGRGMRELAELHPGAVVVAVTRTPELRAAVAPSMAEWRRVPAHLVLVAERGSGIAFWRGGRTPRRIFVVPWERITGIEVGERRVAYGVQVPVVEVHLTAAPGVVDTVVGPEIATDAGAAEAADAQGAPGAVVPFAPAARGLSSPTHEQVAGLAAALRDLRPLPGSEHPTRDADGDDGAR